MGKFEIAFIERFTVGPLLGFGFYPKQNDNDFDELNIYCIFFAIHIKYYNNANT